MYFVFKDLKFITDAMRTFANLKIKRKNNNLGDFLKLMKGL